MEENGYLILTACFCLLFLAGGTLSELKKKPIHLFLTKKIPLLMALPWDTVCKVLGITGGFLFIRKLIFYLPYTGIIQTKFSIWWVDGGNLIFLYVVFVFYMIGIAAIVLQTYTFKTEQNEGCFIFLLMLFLGGGYAIILLIKKISIPLVQGLILVIFAPLILLKMLCSGKFLGILTSFLLGYFIVARYKKLSPTLTMNNLRSLTALIVIIIVLMASGYFIFTGNWQEIFQGKIQSVKNPDAAADLLDAAYTIPGAKDKAIALEKVAAVITSMEDSQWRKERFLQGIKIAGTIEDSKQRNQVLKEIAVFIAAAGDSGWATTIANGIPDQGIKNKALQEIREKIEEQ